MMRKGAWRTLESVSAVIILVFFVLSLGVRYSYAPPDIDLSVVGYELLKDLDSRGELRYYAMNNQTGEIESRISIQGRDHTVWICDFEGVCYGDEPAGQNVWTSSYMVAGEGTYNPREVKLLIW